MWVKTVGIFKSCGNPKCGLAGQAPADSWGATDAWEVYTCSSPRTSICAHKDLRAGLESRASCPQEHRPREGD